MVSVSSPTHWASVVSPTGWPPKRVHNVIEDGPVDLVEAQPVHAEELETLAGRAPVDGTVPAHLGEVAHPSQQPVGHSGRAPGALGDASGAVLVDAHAQNLGRALDDGPKVLGRVEVEPADETEAVTQWPRHETGPRGRADEA